MNHHLNQMRNSYLHLLVSQNLIQNQILQNLKQNLEIFSLAFQHRNDIYYIEIPYHPLDLYLLIFLNQLFLS